MRKCASAMPTRLIWLSTCTTTPAAVTALRYSIPSTAAPARCSRRTLRSRLSRLARTAAAARLEQGQRGDYYAFVRDTKCPAVICEGVFVDTKADAAQAGTKEKQQEFGIAYAKGILDTLGIKYDTSTDKPAEPTKPQAPEVQAAIEKIQTKAGLEEKTIGYLLAYKYGEQLVKKLAEAMEK